ncbi:MAG: UGSC family (seleno)protein [Dehalococcoidales bacterium]
MATYVFEDLTRDERMTQGVPLPFIYTPHPVVGVSPETLYEYVVGNDPDTNIPVIDEIIDALTKPVGDLKVPTKTVTDSGPRQVMIEPDTEDNLQRLFYESGWTDGLPVILPTEERVENMLKGTSHSPDEVVGETFQMDTGKLVQYTVSNIAVVAVMAGARPEYFPVILAIAASKQSALMPSTTAFSAMLLVNGPIRNEIGMNSGIGAFSPVNQANSVIGRAWTLMSICWGYAKPMKTLWSSQGSNAVYNNMCVAENEERSVWTPFHVDRGFKAEESVVSIFRGWSVINSSGAASNRTLGEELNLELALIPPLNSAATIVMDPLVAYDLKNNEGFTTKQDYARWMSENIKMTAERYWQTDYIDMLVVTEAGKGVEPYASWSKLPGDELIAPYHNPDNINLIIVGGETSPLWKATDFRHSASESIDKWRPNASDDDCEDGSCGVPDEEVNYD